MDKKKKKIVKENIEEKPKIKRKRRKKKKKGFTLIELLAVIVILGLLMAIAIPSVTRYITESRKKTLTTTLGNYINALVNEVNDLNYTFTGNNTIYAVPIECIALERGGTNPFGEWYQASNAYWAYVLIQYDDDNSKYVYGFTFKDSAGYGLYPTIQAKIKEKGSQIKTGLDLNKPKTGDITSLTTLANWANSGFEVDSTTNLQVLEAESEGNPGDGVNTCTLAQKGNNYAQVEQDKINNDNKLSSLIKKNNPDIKTNPTLTKTSYAARENGLYSSTATNSGNPTYYFRGNVTNNYVSFAGLIWRIIRINEDGTVRLILDGRVNNTTYKFNSAVNNYSYMYYSNSDTAKPTVDSWYESNLKNYESYIATSTFCEQAKADYNSNRVSGKATMTYYRNYTPTFKCETDGNGKGILNIKIGLITYDELIHAGGYSDNANNGSYLFIEDDQFWTMSPAGFSSSNRYANVWMVRFTTTVSYTTSHASYMLRPVINLNADVTVTGTGTSADPYVIQTD